MSDVVKPCIKCGATNRYKGGKCKPCHREAVRKWSAVNVDKRACIEQKYRESNREKESRRARNWAADNPEKARAKSQNRRAKVKGNGGTLSKGIVQTLMTLQKGKCACCAKSLKDGSHLDHVIPLALGGKNTDDNVQLLTPKCNLSKGAKHPIDYMRAKGRLI